MMALASLYRGSRLEHDLDAIVLLVQEDVIAFGRVVEPHAVRDNEARIDLALLDPFEQRFQIALHVALTALDRNRAVHQRAHRKLIDEPAVDPYDRDRTAIGAGENRLADGVRPVVFQLQRLLRAVVSAEQSRL